MEPEDPSHDTLTIGGGPVQKGIQADNFVKTTRYTVYSFIPLTILENFKRFANIYFLLMAGLSFTPYTPISPVFQVLPLCIVIAISMIKSGVEDLMRYNNDRKHNAILYDVYRDGQFQKVQSGTIHPGELVWLRSGVETPVDILIVASSEPGAICYANEVNLNGETAIKQRKAIFASAGLNPNETASIKGKIVIPLPCNDIQKLDGTLYSNNNSFPFSMKNCILRGVFIEHTIWAVGIALYTGHDTRIIQNQRHPPHKTSHLESRLNKLIIFDFILNLVLVVICTILAVSMDNNLTTSWIIKDGYTVTAYLENFSAYAVLLSYMIPISLYVTLEFVRIYQRWTFAADLGMYTPGLGYCTPNNSNLNEELGQVDHIFSDKTGTLTENVMKLVRISVRGIIYDVENSIETMKSVIDTDEVAYDILRDLAICNNVIITSDGYSAESPDEEALVMRAAELGLTLVERQADEGIVLSHKDAKTVYPHLATIEFNSDRKRMSVIVKNTEGQIVLYCKGADSVMIPALKQDEDKGVVDEIRRQVDEFAEQGLRTLVCAKKILNEAEYTEWKKRYDDAAVQLENREQNVGRVGAEIEKDLTLLGAIAIEDQLQQNVPETIAYLSRMGIKLWILTGDKKETAISIGKSTNVILPSSSVYEASDMEKVHQIDEQLDHDKNGVLVIGFDALTQLIAEDPKLLVSVGEKCRSVICFRMSPSLKSKVVETMKNNTKKICLSIGDGANDVNMIQTAHVGVGIIGREGHQAAANSDFAIPRFKHVKRLCACHGRLSVLRISGCILYMICKNFLMIFPQIMFNACANWSSKTVYDSLLLSTYNLVWTIFPPVEYGWYEQDLSFKSMMSYPHLYHEVRAGRYLSTWRFVLEFINSTYQAFVLFFFVYYLPAETIIDSSGDNYGFRQSGTTLFLTVVMVANLQSVLRTHAWNIYMFLGVYLSVFIFFLLVLPYGALSSYEPSMYFIPQSIFTTYNSYFIIFLAIITALAPEALFRFLKALWYPSYSRIIREMEQLGISDKTADEIKERADTKKLEKSPDKIHKSPLN